MCQLCHTLVCIKRVYTQICQVMFTVRFARLFVSLARVFV